MNELNRQLHQLPFHLVWLGNNDSNDDNDDDKNDDLIIITKMI